MRIEAFARGAAILAALGLALTCSACASAAGEIAGTTVGYAAKGGGMTVKVTGKTVKTAGRVVVGAVRGVHDEFSGSNDSDNDTAYVEDHVDYSQAQGATLTH